MPSRTAPPRASRVRPLAALLTATLVATGCAGPSIPPPSPALAATLEPAVAQAVRDDLPLDPASRDLIAITGRDEVLHVTISTTWTADLLAAAQAAGMTAAIVDPGATIAIDGALGAALDLVRTAPVTAVRVEDLRAALRPIPRGRPIVVVPQPGRPYLGVGFADASPNVTLVAPQREPMFRGLAGAIETIDGRPYARLDLDGGCGVDKAGASCRLVAIGFTRGSVGWQDELSVVGTERTGWAGIVEPLSVLRRSVPRPLLRAAEWIARQDVDATARIRTYASCCVATWDPARPGVIGLEYERPCGPALGAIGRERADTGECSDRLRVAVDVGASAVISIEERIGTM